MRRIVTRSDIRNTMIELCKNQSKFYNHDVRMRGGYSETEAPPRIISLIASGLEIEGKLEIKRKGNMNCYESKLWKSI